MEAQRSSLLAENDAVRQQYRDDRNAIYDGDAGQAGSGEPEMSGDAIFIAGDVMLPPEPKPAATAPTATTAAPAKTSNPLLTAALAAALGGAGGIGGMAIYNAVTKPADTSVVQPDKPATPAVDTTGTLQKDQ